MARSEARVRVFSSQRPFVVVEISRSPLWDFLPGRCSQGANFRFGRTEKPLKTAKKPFKIVNRKNREKFERVLGRFYGSSRRTGRTKWWKGRGRTKTFGNFGSPLPFLFRMGPCTNHLDKQNLGYF